MAKDFLLSLESSDLTLSLQDWKVTLDARVIKFIDWLNVHFIQKYMNVGFLAQSTYLMKGQSRVLEAATKIIFGKYEGI